MFPIVAVVTHCHKLSSLNKTNLLLLSSGGQKSKNGLYWAQIKVPAAMHFFLEAVEENLLSRLFHLLEAALISWLMALCFIFRVEFFSHCIFPTYASVIAVITLVPTA